MKRYQVILADPPWQYRNSGGNGAAGDHYPTMSFEELCDLPVHELAADDAVLLLWGTWPQLPDALALVNAWGFEYKTGFPWVKLQRPATVDLFGDMELVPSYGCGHWVRGCSELIFICTRGNIACPHSNDLGLLSERFEHSRKPDSLHQYAEHNFTGPYLELFARRSRPGWDAWGNQVNSTIDMKETAL